MSSQISDEIEIDSEYLKSDEYMTCRNTDFKRDLSEKFFRKYLINMKCGNIEDAFWAAIHCAWTCDDAEDENAVTSKKLAIDLAERLIEEDINYKDTLRLIKVDLLRRTHAFDETIEE